MFADQDESSKDMEAWSSDHGQKEGLLRLFHRGYGLLSRNTAYTARASKRKIYSNKCIYLTWQPMWSQASPTRAEKKRASCGWTFSCSLLKNEQKIPFLSLWELPSLQLRPKVYKLEITEIFWNSLARDILWWMFYTHFEFNLCIKENGQTIPLSR